MVTASFACVPFLRLIILLLPVSKLFVIVVEPSHFIKSLNNLLFCNASVEIPSFNCSKLTSSEL